MLNGKWKESEARVVELPDDEPQVFSVYQQWRYGGRTNKCFRDAAFRPGDEYELLVKAYILGEEFIDPEFKDCVVDAIIENLQSTQRFQTHLTNVVFENTPTTSSLRRLWMDIYFQFGGIDWLDSKADGEETNPEFMIEFSRSQMQHRQGFGYGTSHAMFVSCTYHEHGARPCPCQGLNVLY